MDNKELLLTQEGYDNIISELDYLKSVKRAEIAQRIKTAITFGDITENAEFDEAKNEQAQMEDRIRKLEDQLRIARVVNNSESASDVVTIGSNVKIEIKDSSMKKYEVEEYTIVGSTEADPTLFKISNKSPIGSALLGRKVGEKLSVSVPMGLVKIKIIEITR